MGAQVTRRCNVASLMTSCLYHRAVASPPPIPGLRMGALLGEGTTGAIYAAVNAQGDELAVKLLRESLADSPEMVLRFRREASTAQHLRSEYIAQVVSA